MLFLVILKFGGGFLNIRPFLINLNVPASSSHIRNIVINDADNGVRVTYEQQWIEEYKTNQEDTFDKDTQLFIFFALVVVITTMETPAYLLIRKKY